MSKKIIGITVGSPLPKPNLKQTDPTKGDYVKGRDMIPTKLSQLENDIGVSSGSGIHIGPEPPDGENISVWLDTDEESTGGMSSGSASIDVTAEVGQTIIVEEVDANGKPTKWKAAEYQPRTHWMGEKVILPETTVEGVHLPNMVINPIPLMGLIEGHTYVVNLNGVDYTCVAKRGVSVFADTTYDVTYIGNSMLETGVDDGIPFACGDVPAFVPDPMSFFVVPINGIHTVSVTGVNELNKIPTKFVPTLEEMRTTETVVLEETTITPNADGYLEFSPLTVPSIGVTYKVTYNGTEYECEAVDGAAMAGIECVLLGNYGIATGNDTGEPFLLVITSMDGATIGQLLNLEVSETFVLSITEVKTTPIPPKYLPEGIGYCEMEELLNETLTSLEGQPGNFTFNSIVPLTVHNTYHVTYNGVDYDCVAFYFNIDSVEIVYIGNPAYVCLDNTSEPFFIATVTANGETITMCVDYSEATEVTVRITGEKISKIPTKYIPTLEEMQATKTTMFTESELEYDEEMGAFIFYPSFLPSVGKTYYVRYNGKEYTCTCAGTVGEWVFGNVPAAMETGDNGIPFIVVFIADADGLFSAVVPLDGAETVKCGIKQRDYISISTELIPNQQVVIEGWSDDAASHKIRLIGDVDANLEKWRAGSNRSNAPLIFRLFDIDPYSNSTVNTYKDFSLGKFSYGYFTFTRTERNLSDSELIHESIQIYHDAVVSRVISRVSCSNEDIT